MDESTQRALKQYIYILKDLKQKCISSEVFNLYDEFLGTLEDERHFNHEANHAYSDIAQAYIYEIQRLPRQERVTALTIFIDSLKEVVSWHKEDDK